MKNIETLLSRDCMVSATIYSTNGMESVDLVPTLNELDDDSLGAFLSGFTKFTLLGKNVEPFLRSKNSPDEVGRLIQRSIQIIVRKDLVTDNFIELIETKSEFALLIRLLISLDADIEIELVAANFSDFDLYAAEAVLSHPEIETLNESN
jgi:hypothetical protein